MSLDWPESAAYLGKYENRNRYLRESAAFNPCRLRGVGYLQVHEKRRRCESTGVRFHSAACADSLSAAHSGRVYGIALRYVVRLRGKQIAQLPNVVCDSGFHRRGQ